MSNKENKATKAQGAEVVTDGNVSRETKKQQAKSVSYAIKAIGEHVKTLKKAGYMSDDMFAKFEDWRTTVGSEFLKKQLGIDKNDE